MIEISYFLYVLLLVLHNYLYLIITMNIKI